MSDRPSGSWLRIGGRDLPPTTTRISIGRDEAADIVVASPLVSRQHATVERVGDEWRFEDGQSRNGSFLDGRRIDRLTLGERTLIRLGAVDGPEVVIEIVGVSPASERTPTDRRATSLGRPSVIHDVPTAALTIGRDPANDLVVDDLRASRRHARVSPAADGTIILEDLGSQNGTFVNGQRIERLVLADGDLVGIGATTFRVAGGRLEEFHDGDASWLAAVGLGVSIDGRTLLDDVSFALEPSSLLGVVGPSGAGKSTLLNALTGFRPADRGTVLYGGRDLYAAYGEFRQRIGYVPQSDILHTQLTVEQALSYAAELRFPADVGASERQARVTEVMAELGLSERRSLQISRLSGGQRKRTSVGIELLTRPSLLFLDEPTSGLDPANEANLMDLLRDLARGGRTVVVVTHSLQSLDRCDRVLYLAPGGRLAYYGPPTESGAYFGRLGVRPGADNIFRDLDEVRDRDWKAAFEADPLFGTHVSGPLSEAGPRGPSMVTPPAPPQPPTPWGRQLSVLVRRYLAVIRADRGVLALLALQAPIFGLLFLFLFRSNVFSTLFAIEAAVLVWLLALGATWLGTSNAIREIVKELPVSRRERAIGLSTTAYLASKVLVLGVITVAQTLVMVLIATSGQHLPAENASGYEVVTAGLPPGLGPQVPEITFEDHGAVLPSISAELLLGAALTGFAGMAVALFVSAVVRTTDRAATALPIILIAQTVVSAPLLGAPPPVLREIGYLSTTQWGFSAMAATVDLNDIRAPFLEVQAYLRSEALGGTYVAGRADRPTWAHDPSTWILDMAMLLTLTVASLIGAWFALRRMDPNVERRRPVRAPPARAVPVTSG